MWYHHLTFDFDERKQKVYSSLTSEETACQQSDLSLAPLRRYSDFAWLFERLHKERPGAIVPPLPEKQQTARFNETFIEERRFQLEKFLRRVICNPELKDTECLLVFLSGGDTDFKRAKKDGFGRVNSDSAARDLSTGEADFHGGVEMNTSASEGDEQNENSIVDKGRETVSHKKAGLKRWLKEKKTAYSGSLVRLDDDAIFEEVAHFVEALEAGLKRVEAQASLINKQNKDTSTSLLEFGLGCDAISHVENEVDGGTVDSHANGVGETFHIIGKAADEAAAISGQHYQRELQSFVEPLRDHLKMIQAVKVALTKRNNRRITYSTNLNSVDSKKASLHKFKITPGLENKALGAESSLSKAEQAVLASKQNYDEVAARVLRQVDLFRRESAVAMCATMKEFAASQADYYSKLNESWGSLLPKVDLIDTSRLSDRSFAQAAAALSSSVHVNMPQDPPPPAPNGEIAAINGGVRYRDPLPDE